MKLFRLTSPDRARMTLMRCPILAPNRLRKFLEAIWGKKLSPERFWARFAAPNRVQQVAGNLLRPKKRYAATCRRYFAVEICLEQVALTVLRLEQACGKLLQPRLCKDVKSANWPRVAARVIGGYSPVNRGAAYSRSMSERAPLKSGAV
jgi:hypothetical protein